jgi:16S rRNA U1498 N3-methylase RsmE
MYRNKFNKFENIEKLAGKSCEQCKSKRVTTIVPGIRWAYVQVGGN